MKKVLMLLQILFYLAGAFTLPSLSNGMRVEKIKITHTHPASEHHSHDHLDENSPEHHHYHDHTSHHHTDENIAKSHVPDDPEHQHTHEILVVTGTLPAVAVASNSIKIEPPALIYPQGPEPRAPMSPGLGSIFRPPIA